MKRISLKGASWDSMFLAGARILTLLFGIISTKIMSVGLSLAEYGTYSQANLVSTVGTSVIALGLVDSLNYFFNKDNEDEDTRARIINTVFFLEILLGAIFIFFVLACQNLISAYFSNEAVKHLLAVVSFLPVMSNLLYFYHVLFVSVGKAKLMSLYNLILMAVRLVAVYAAVYVFDNLLIIFSVILSLDVLQILIYHFSLKKKGVKICPVKISKSHIRAILAYSLPMGIYVLTNAVTRDLGKMVIGRLADTETLAIYTNCSKVLPLDFIAVSFATVLIPFIIKYVTAKDKEMSISLFSEYLKVGYYSVWILGTMVLVSPSTMVSFLYSSEYLAGKAVFVLYVFDSMIRFASTHLILVAANKAKHVMAYSIISLILNLLLNIVLYKLLGLVGPAVSTLICAVVYVWLIINKTIKTIDAKWSNVFDLKEISLFGLSLLALWGICYSLNKVLINFANIDEYVSMVLCMAVFGLLSLAMHFKRISAVLKNINKFRK